MVSDEFVAFMEEARKIGMADVKALEAAMDDAASHVPGGETGAPLRAALIQLLSLGVEYSRIVDGLKEEEEKHG